MYPAITLGIIGAGGCWTGTNPSYTASELTHHFRKSNTKLIITEPEHLQQVLAAATTCDIAHSRIFTFSPSPYHDPRVACRDWNTLLQHGESDWIRFNDAQRSSATPIGLFSTSGTTGLPKMAARTHLSFVAESVAIQERQSKPYPVRVHRSHISQTQPLTLRIRKYVYYACHSFMHTSLLCR